MSVTLSMPIHWLCLRLTTKFYSPMSPSPKSRKFWLWPDLWRHQWPPGQIFDLVRVVHVQGYRMTFKFGNRSSSLGDLRGGPFGPPPPAGRVTIQTPAGRGLSVESQRDTTTRPAIGCPSYTTISLYQELAIRVAEVWTIFENHRWSQFFTVTIRVNDTYKCQKHYPCRFVGFVWA